MTSPEPLQVEADGALAPAKTRLSDAVSKLIDPQPQLVDGKTVWIDSPYVQLVEALPGEQGNGHGVARSLPPMWLDAADLLQEIDTACAAWEPRVQIDLSVDMAEVPPITVTRLQALEARKWRPQDTRAIEQIAGNVESWVQNIKTLLSPIPKWSLPNACPACAAQVVYRRDSAGDVVRQPALQIGPEGCECQRCHHNWPPDRFQFLAQVLQYPKIEGVLE